MVSTSRGVTDSRSPSLPVFANLGALSWLAHWMNAEAPNWLTRQAGKLLGVLW